MTPLRIGALLVATGLLLVVAGIAASEWGLPLALVVAGAGILAGGALLVRGAT